MSGRGEGHSLCHHMKQHSFFWGQLENFNPTNEHQGNWVFWDAYLRFAQNLASCKLTKEAFWASVGREGCWEHRKPERGKFGCGWGQRESRVGRFRRRALHVPSAHTPEWLVFTAARRHCQRAPHLWGTLRIEKYLSYCSYLSAFIP